MPRSLSALLALFIVACSDEGSRPGNNDAELRVVHATANAAAVDVLIDGEPVLTGVGFGTTRQANVPAGTRQLTFRSGGVILGEITADLTTEHVNAVIVANGTPQLSSAVIPDTGAVAPARANLRLVNVVGTNLSEPTQLQALLNFPGVSTDSTAKLGFDATVARYGSLMYFDPGHFRLQYVPTGTTNVLVETEFDIALGEVKVAVLSRDPDGTYRVSIVSEN